MKESLEPQVLEVFLANISAFITYQPLRTEVRASEHFKVSESAVVYEILPRASLDPLQEVEKARVIVESLPTAIFLPGRKFDALGTRLGQGGGWYDRFLANAPVEWLRVGFCYDDQFSETPLPRQSWDEPVDVVCVLNRDTNELSCIETRARMPAFLGN